MRRFEVEDLPQERWNRIERTVFEKLDQEGIEPAPSSRVQTSGTRRAVVSFVLAGAAAAVIGAVAWEKLRPASHVEQAANVSRVTTDDAASHVQVGENELDVAAHSSVAVRGNDAAGIEIALDQGEVECEVAPRQGRPPFVVTAGGVRVRVVGTHFHVVHHGETTNVSVQRGTVEVTERASVTLVHAGESWPAPPPPPQPTAAAVDPTATALATQAQPPAVAPLPTAAQRRERYEKALALESSQPEAALSMYRELAAGSDAWAMNALFAHARLELERGHKDDAKRLANEYLSRFPSGPNARDARELRTRLE